MTKVNLLPDSIWEPKRKRQLWMIVLALLVLEGAALGFIAMGVKNQRAELEAERDQKEVQAKAVDDLNSKAQAIQASIKPIVDKTKYVEDILTYNKRFPALFERTNMYTTSRVSYRQLQPAQTVLNMTAYAKNVSDIGRYLLNIQRAKDTFQAVSITSQMPGWPAGNTSGGTSYTGPAGPTSFGPGGPIGPGFTPTDTSTTPAVPNTIDFTAVGLLTQKYQFTLPSYGPAAATDTSGYGASSFGPGGPAGYMGPGTGAPPPPGGGANGGGANGGS